MDCLTLDKGTIKQVGKGEHNVTFLRHLLSYCFQNFNCNFDVIYKRYNSRARDEQNSIQLIFIWNRFSSKKT